MPGRRLEVGFEGGTTLRLTMAEDAARQLTSGLSDDGTWRSVETEEGTYWLNMGEVIYIRLVPGEVPGRVGFGPGDTG
jgi:hypothetical protein